MTQQAINLGFLPRMNVVHTEGREIGQIYVPFVNWALAAGTLTAVIGFGSSDALAGAFGIAVSLLMMITTLMATFVALHWKHNPLIVYAVNGSLLALDLLFFASTSTKLLDGGWFPLLIAFAISFLMLTWRKGEELMDAFRLEVREPSKEFIERSARPADPHSWDRHRPRPDGQGRAARALAQRQLQPGAAGARVSGRGRDDGDAARNGRGAGCRHPAIRRHHPVELRFGFMEDPNVPEALAVDSGREDREIRSQPGDLLYRARDDHPVLAPPRPGPMARGDLRLHASQCPASGRLLQDPGPQIMEIGVEFEI